MITRPVLTTALLAALWATAIAQEPKDPAAMPPIPTVEAIAAMLPKQPAGLGRPITDRDAWKALASHEVYRRVLARAETLLDQPMPETTDELYLDFSKTGNRSRWQKVAGRRRKRITAFTIAECMENSGRFIPKLVEAIGEVCAERTWVMPAHDRALNNFKNTRIDIDLGSSHLGNELAMVCWLLGDRLPAETRTLIRENLERRIFKPFEGMIARTRRQNWWLHKTNNWNSVCLASVTGTALAVIETRSRRAKFIHAGMTYSRNFLKGFTADGYCSEGLGYWGYGYGHYVLLAEMIWQSTGGKIDLLKPAAARAPAMFPDNIVITDGVSPAFADCKINATAPKHITYFLHRRYGLAGSPRTDKTMITVKRGLRVAMMYSFPNSATAAKPSGREMPEPPLRSYFDKMGVLIARPGEGSPCKIGVAIKGGNNADHHNHNDVGSYVVVLGGRPVLVDPGGEVYTSRTFSAKRYDSGVLNSFGHPVPRVAGTLQKTGRSAQAKILKTTFTDVADTLAMDIRSAYAVKGLKTLTRTFTFSRKGSGSLTVVDDVAFDSPQAFETALITLGTFKQTAPAALRVTYGEQTLRVTFNATGGQLEVASEKIKEDVHTKTLPTRIALRFKAPIKKATITVVVTPVVD